jgi:hypothetical protein
MGFELMGLRLLGISRSSTPDYFIVACGAVVSEFWLIFGSYGFLGPEADCGFDYPIVQEPIF